tara:strand:- start:2097 stop:2405 length:309 start_codon:yes stop_codon:yes gene_type:complete
MCEREDIRIDVSDKPDSVNMAKFWWQFMFQKIAKDYPGYDKVHIVYFDEQYTLKGLLVDGDDPKFFEEMTKLTNVGYSYFMERTWDKEKHKYENTEDNDAPF